MSQEETQKLRGTHVKLTRGDYLLLCALAGVQDEEKVMEIDERAERIYEKDVKDIIETAKDLVKNLKLTIGNLEVKI